MQRVLVYLFFVGFVWWIVLLCGVNQVNAFSISPSPLRIENIHPRYPITKQITVGRRDAARAIDVEVQKQGKDADSIQLGAEKFTIPAGEQYFQYEFILDAKGVEPGEKEAQIVFMGTEQGDAGSGLALRIGLTDKMSWSVTTTVLRDIELSDFTSDKADDRFGSLERKLSFYIKNNGNVTEDVAEIKYSFFKKGKLAVEKSVEFKKTILPFSYIEDDLPFSRWRLKRGQEYEVRILARTADGREIIQNQNLVLLRDKSLAQKRSVLEEKWVSLIYKTVVLYIDEAFEKLLDLFG